MSRLNVTRRQRVALLLASAVALPATIYLAGSARGQIVSDALGPPVPPSLAYTVCNAKGASDACEVAMSDGTKMSGTCDALPDGKAFCHPAAPPGPPPELLSACVGQSEGAACKGNFLDKTSFQGTCRKDISGRQICR
jgi:hypothetical protein